MDSCTTGELRTKKYSKSFAPSKTCRIVSTDKAGAEIVSIGTRLNGCPVDSTGVDNAVLAFFCCSTGVIWIDGLALLCVPEES